MSTVVFWLAEFGFVFFLAGLAISAPAPRPLVWLVFLVVGALSLVPWLKRRPRIASSALLVIALALMGLEHPIRWTSSFEDCWLTLPALVLLSAGLLGLLDDYQQGTSWSTLRRELTVTGALLAFFGTMTVIITFLLTTYYSDKKIPLGNPGFLYTCVVLGCTWFGLDAGLRRIPFSKKLETVGYGWMWNQRHSLLLGLTALVILLRVTVQ